VALRAEVGVDAVHDLILEQGVGFSSHPGVDVAALYPRHYLD